MYFTQNLVENWILGCNLVVDKTSQNYAKPQLPETTIFVIIRGGVENTRLEAKAKDTKKIQGQGQEELFRGQALSRKRTGMLEAKAKDQGHKRKCSPKKKRSSQNFSGDLHKKTFSEKFFKRSTKFNNSKNSAVLETRTSQSSRT